MGSMTTSLLFVVAILDTCFFKSQIRISPEPTCLVAGHRHLKFSKGLEHDYINEILDLDLYQIIKIRLTLGCQIFICKICLHARHLAKFTIREGSVSVYP